MRMNESESKKGKRDVMRNFCFLSVCFSLNHACVAGCISLASSDLGENLASISLGVRFIHVSTCLTHTHTHKQNTHK